MSLICSPSYLIYLAAPFSPVPKALKISRYGCFPNTTGLYILQHMPCGEPIWHGKKPGPYFCKKAECMRVGGYLPPKKGRRASKRRLADENVDEAELEAAAAQFGLPSPRLT